MDDTKQIQTHSFLFYMCTGMSMSINLNSVVNDDAYREIVDYWPGKEYESAINAFKNYLRKNNFFAEEASNSKDDAPIDKYKFLKDKRIDFNKKNTFLVEETTLEFSKSKPNWVYTQLVFNFQGENISLNLSRKDIVKFLNDDYFKPFVVPTEVYLKFNPEDPNDLKIQMVISSSYRNIYSFKEPIEKNIVHSFEFLRNLFIISLKNYNEHVEKTRIANNFFEDTLEDKYKNLAADMKRLTFYEEDVMQTGYYLTASQFISGMVYSENFTPSFKAKIIVLSENLEKIFSAFENTVRDDAKNLIKANFLNLKISKSVMEQNKGEFEEIFKIVNEIYKKGTLFRSNSSRAEIKSLLKILKEKALKKIMSPIVIQKILNHARLNKSLIQGNTLKNNSEFGKEVATAKETNAKMQEYINDEILKMVLLSKGIQDGRIPIFDINDFSNTSLTTKAFLDRHPNKITKNFYSVQIYSKLDNLVMKLEENDGDFNKDPAIKADIEDLKGLMGMGQFNQYVKDIVKRETHYLEGYKKLTGRLEIIGKLVDTTELNYLDHRMIADEFNSNMRSRLFYSYNTGQYIVFVPRNERMDFLGDKEMDVIGIFEAYKLNINELRFEKIDKNGLIEFKVLNGRENVLGA